jgi:LmbE family N-acetylglucosaminyl deacetylase
MRALDVSPTALGTPEEVWLADGRLEALPLLRWTAGVPVVVVAPHPDDETLGAGGLLRAAHRTGSPITIVAVTDGEASHPGSSTSPAELRRRRPVETTEAMHRLGLDDATVVRCGLPDGGVEAHEHQIEHTLRLLLSSETVCLATWRHDGHPDHEAVGRAASAAASACGARLVEIPIWAWHWATPSAGLPLDHARRWPLDDADRAAKARAIRAYRSQIEPLGPGPADRAGLPPAVRARFERPFEVLLEDGRP